MISLYLDLESIPSQKPDAKDGIEVSHPATMSKPETIEKWEKEKKPGEIDKIYHKQGLDGTRGNIICIAWALGEGKIQSVQRDLTQPESGLLTEFFERLFELNGDHTKRSPEYLWVGHNITGFDLRFLWNRCVINQVKPSIAIPYDAKPWDKNVFDTCIKWKGQYGSTSGKLDEIAKAMGHKGKGDLDGSKVWEYVQAGKIDEVVEYCKQDVEMTRLLHNRMTFN